MTIIAQRYNGTEWVNETFSGGGGGSSNHASLTNLDWTLSAHEGTVDTLAGFDSTGVPIEYTESDYFLVDGTRAMTNDLEMGTNDINDVDDIDAQTGHIDAVHSDNVYTEELDVDTTANIGTLNLTTDLGVNDGGTGQSTEQLAINALTAVAGATNEYVLTKDTSTGNAIFKEAAGGDVEGTAVLSTGETITKYLRADGDGTSSWQVVTHPATGANTALSNLTTTSINQSLIPSSNEGQDLGTPTTRWDDIYCDDLTCDDKVTCGRLDVENHGNFQKDIEVNDEITCEKITAQDTDPETCEYEAVTRQTVIDRYKILCAVGKTSAVQFLNIDTELMELYYVYKGEFRDMMGNLLHTVPIQQNEDVKIRYYTDSMIGEIKQRLKGSYPKYRKNPLYIFNAKTGLFEDRKDRNIIISKEEGLTLINDKI